MTTHYDRYGRLFLAGIKKATDRYDRRSYMQVGQQVGLILMYRKMVYISCNVSTNNDLVRWLEIPRYHYIQSVDVPTPLELNIVRIVKKVKKGDKFKDCIIVRVRK